jgi:hypothetical protein
MQQQPHGSCGSLVDPLVPGSVKHPGASARLVMVRPDDESGSARGEERRRKPLRRSGSDALRRGLGGSGTTAVGPGWKGSSALESAELSTSYSSEFEAVEHRRQEGAAGAATHHGLSARKSSASENPMSGSGPSEFARPEGEEPVEGVRNPEDGTCRVRQARVMRIPPPMSLKGHETPGGAIWPGMAREGISARTLRGRRSLREPPVGLRTERTAGRWNSSWSYKRRGGGGEPIAPLRRAERSERPVNPARVVPGTATSRLNSRSAAETPGGASTDLSVPTTGGPCCRRCARASRIR